MYLRVKRKRLTVFLQVEPTDTVLEVKAKLQALVEQVRGGLRVVPCVVCAVCRVYARADGCYLLRGV